MDIEDHIFALLTKKLANEASEKELNELDELLQQYPDIHNKIKLITEWWYSDTGRDADTNSYLRFGKILKKIKIDRFEK